MDVRHCPQCGSTDISTSRSSFEYGSSKRWGCNDCSWYYKRGRGIGTGTGNSGTHPRELSGRDQEKLTPTGEYCSNCEVVIADDHACTADAVLDGDPQPQSEVIEALDEWHVNPRTELEENVKDGKVDLTPIFYYVTGPSDDPAIYDDILDVVEQIIDEQGPEDKNTFTDPEYAAQTTIVSRLAAENSIESAFINRCLDEMRRKRLLVRGHYGYKTPDE